MKGRGRGGDAFVFPHSTLVAALLAYLLFTFTCILVPADLSAQESIQPPTPKQVELREREEALKREEERIAALKKDVEEKIREYAALLAKIEEALKKVGQVKDEQITNVVKAYEAMPPEDAADRISALDDGTALLILVKMKSKKAGAVLALIEPKKAAILTKSMAGLKIRY